AAHGQERQHGCLHQPVRCQRLPAGRLLPGPGLLPDPELRQSVLWLLRQPGLLRLRLLRQPPGSVVLVRLLTQGTVSGTQGGFVIRPASRRITNPPCAPDNGVLFRLSPSPPPPPARSTVGFTSHAPGRSGKPRPAGRNGAVISPAWRGVAVR